MAVSMRLGEGLRRALIPVIDRTAPLRGRLAQAGGVLPLGRFPEAEIDCYLHKLSTRGRYRLSRGEIRELLLKTSGYSVRALLTIISGHGGRRTMRQSGALRGSRAPGNGPRKVGNRVKLFMDMGNESEENGTEFVPHTNRTRWRTFTGRLAAPERGGWFVPQRRGDVLIFDTNVVHRGRYSGSERVILQVEFSSIFKKPGSVRALRSLLPQQIGTALRRCGVMLDRVATSSRVRLPENTAMRRRRRTLYIFVEVGARELLSRLVVAEEARRRGYRVVLGEKNLLRNLCWMFPLPAGIILDKCGQMCRSYPVLALKRRGFRYVVLDEEGIFFAHANRAPEPSDLLLFNSEYQRRRSNRQGSSTDVVGNPRLYPRALLPYLDREVQA